MVIDDIVRDTVEIDLQIGGSSWEIIDCIVELTKWKTPDYADMIVTPAKGTEVPEGIINPERDDTLLGAELTLDVNTDLRVDNEEEEITRIFTGYVANMTPTGEYTYELIAYDPSQQKFDTSGTASTSFMNAKLSLARPAGVNPATGEPLSSVRKVRASGILEDIFSLAQLENAPDKDEPGTFEVQLQQGGDEDGYGFDPEVTFSRDATIGDVIDDLELATRSTTYFTRNGKLVFGPPPSESFNLRYITDSSAGKMTPAYRSVRVVGDGVVSAEGWEKSALYNEDPYVTLRNVYEDSGGEEATSEQNLAEPVFTYRNLEINTQREAEHIADELTDKLNDQRAGGTITVVGFPEIRPYDSVQMPHNNEEQQDKIPNYQPRQAFGGARYGIVKVSHRLNTSDGFVTKLECGGLIGKQKALYDEDLESALDNTFDPDWSSTSIVSY